jgi:hypothetical protein
MVMFHSYVSLPEGKSCEIVIDGQCPYAWVKRCEVPGFSVQFGVQKLSPQDQASTPCDAPRFPGDREGSKEREQLFVGFKMDWFKGKFTGNHGFYH